MAQNPFKKPLGLWGLCLGGAKMAGRGLPPPKGLANQSSWAGEEGGGPAVCPKGSWEPVGTRAGVRDQGEVGATQLAQVLPENGQRTFWRPPQPSPLICKAPSSSVAFFFPFVFPMALFQALLSFLLALYFFLFVFSSHVSSCAPFRPEWVGILVCCIFLFVLFLCFLPLCSVSHPDFLAPFLSSLSSSSFLHSGPFPPTAPAWEASTAGSNDLRWGQN